MRFLAAAANTQRSYAPAERPPPGAFLALVVPGGCRPDASRSAAQVAPEEGERYRLLATGIGILDPLHG
jgi:hypothetical protein